MQNRNAFTLIELLLVISLIAITITVTSLGVSKVLFSERFEKDAQRLQNICYLAETLSCTEHSDVIVHCSAMSKGLVCSLKAPSFRQTVVLKNIQEIFLDQQPTPITMRFQDSLYPRGHLEIKGKHSSYFLQFPGYPGGLVLSRSPQPLGVEHATSYPQELLPAA